MHFTRRISVKFLKLISFRNIYNSCLLDLIIIDLIKPTRGKYIYIYVCRLSLVSKLRCLHIEKKCIIGIYEFNIVSDQFTEIRSCYGKRITGFVFDVFQTVYFVINVIATFDKHSFFLINNSKSFIKVFKFQTFIPCFFFFYIFIAFNNVFINLYINIHFFE